MFTGMCSFIEKLYRKLFYNIWTYSHTNTVLPTDSNSVGVLLSSLKDYHSISTRQLTLLHHFTRNAATEMR